MLDFSPSVAFRADAGALGMALHPQFADPVAPQPYVYVCYNADPPPTHQRLSRFTWNPATKVFDLASQLILRSRGRSCRCQFAAGRGVARNLQSRST